jgi:hypothetical protein
MEAPRPDERNETIQANLQAAQQADRLPCSAGYGLTKPSWRSEMASVGIFETLANGVRSFEPLPVPVDADVARAAQTVDEARSVDGKLGFFKRRSAIQDLEDLGQVLAEHGEKLAAPGAAKVLSVLKQWDELRAARRRFVIQVVISIVVLVIAGTCLAFANPSEAAQKSLYALVGTVVGYWLR